MINFASDNSAPVHPKILEKLASVNSGALSSYGNDAITKQTSEMFKMIFGAQVEVFFVFNGTGANTVAIDTLTDKYSMVLTAPAAHITEDECGAPSKITGCPIRFVCNTPRKITPTDLKPLMALKGDVHKSQPRVVSISQVTEMGEIYTHQELEALSAFCKENDLLLHIDGARISNAATALDCAFADAAYGADILSFGGTKNGMMIGDALVVLNPAYAQKAAYLRKQNMQLASKMRYISAQFMAMLEDNLWHKNAVHANKMAKLLYEGIKNMPHVNILYPVEANMIFLELPTEKVNKLLKTFYFYPMKEENGVTMIRLMASWDTKQQDVEALIKAIGA